MNDDEVKAIVCRLIVNAMPEPIAEHELSAEMSMAGDLGIGSLALAMVLFGLEEELDVDLAALDIDFRGIETVGDMLEKGCAIARAPTAHREREGI